MNDSLWYLLGFIAITNWLIYVTIIMPSLRRKRTIYLKDWGFSPFQPLRNLFEYKSTCERENTSLIWFKTQILLLMVFIVLGFLTVFIFWLIKTPHNIGVEQTPRKSPLNLKGFGGAAHTRRSQSSRESTIDLEWPDQVSWHLDCVQNCAYFWWLTVIWDEV